MKNFFAFLAVSLAMASTAKAQTHVNGSVEGIWTKANSPYIVDNHIQVSFGKTLTIEPGVEVRFENFKQFRINGTLIAIGAVGDSIVFTRNGDQRWNYLEFSSNARGELRFVLINGADTGFRSYAAKIRMRDIRIANSSQFGFYLNDDADVVIVRALLENNAKYIVFGFADAVISHSVVVKNNTSFSATVSCAFGRLIFNNSVVRDNSGPNTFVTSNNGQIHLVNCVAVNNSVSNKVFNADGSILNSILRGSSSIDATKKVTVAYSNVEGGAAGTGNIDAEPLFVDPANGDYSLQPTSPCIDAGRPSVFYNDDDGTQNDMGIAGGSDILPIPTNLHFDYGAAAGGDMVDFRFFNFRNTPFLLSDITFSDPQNFSSDFTINTAVAPDTGHAVTITFEGTTSGAFEDSVMFSSPDFLGGNNPAVKLTGFSGIFGDVNGTWTKARSPYLVTGDILVPAGETLVIEPGVVVQFADDFLFEIRGRLEAIGAASDSIIFTRYNDGITWLGIRFDKAEVSTLQFVKIEYVDADRNHDRGRAVYARETDLTVRNCTIIQNKAYWDGGGLYFHGSDTKIVDTDIIANESSDDGGGLYCSASKLTLVRCRIAQNKASRGGGVFNAYQSKILASNCSVFQNGAGQDGIGKLWLSDLTVNNCTFYGNTASGNNSGGIVLEAHSSAEISNTIIRGASQIYTGYLNETEPVLRYCNAEGGYEGEGNIDTDPLFVDPENGDFTLQSGSPSRDAGNPSAFFDDWDGSRNDMGAFGGSGLLIKPTAVDFGPTGQGQQKSIFVFLSNYRDTGFQLTAASVTDNTNFALAVNLPLTIAAMATDSITVSINPSVTGVLNEEIIFTSPDFVSANPAAIPLHALAGVWQGPVSGNWTIANSPVILGGDVVVPFGSSLKIDPGVEVLADTSISGSDIDFIVEGSLLAEGSEINPIKFGVVNGQQAPGTWQGIHLLLRSPNVSNTAQQAREDAKAVLSKAVGYEKGASPEAVRAQPAEARTTHSSTQQATSMALLRYCQIQYATTGITAEHDSVRIENCTIANSSQHGIRWNGEERSASGRAIGNTIENNGEWGIYCYSFCYELYGNANPLISGNTIRNNGKGGIYLFADGGSPFSWTGTVDRANSSPVIRDNVIANNRGPAIAGFASGDWTDGIPFDHYSYAHTEPTLEGNILASNDAGIETRSPGYGNGRRLSFSEFGIDRSTLWGQSGATVFAKDSANVTMKNSIIWEAGAGPVVLENGGTLTVTYSDIQGGYAGNGNINADPLFVDPFNKNFSLQEGSPAINAGDPASPLDPDETRADMGAIPFLQKPAAPSLVSPANGAINVSRNVTLQWNSPRGAISYRLQLSTDSLFATTVIDSMTGVADTTLTAKDLMAKTTYYWRVEAHNNAGASSYSSKFNFTTEAESAVDEQNDELPTEFALSQNFPNPFNPETVIAFDLPTSQSVIMKVYDLNGREIVALVNGNFSAGRHRVSWNGKDRVDKQVPSGIYLCQISAGPFKRTMKMSLLR